MATPTLQFHELVEAVDQLPIDARDELIEIIRRRAAEARRQEMLEAVRESRAEYDAGLCKTGSVEDLLREIES